MLGIDDWMNARVKKNVRGSILDRETGEHVEVMTARASVFLAETAARADFNNTHYPHQIIQLASDQAKASNSDPFAHDRTRTHLENGLCAMQDYNVDFQKIFIPISGRGPNENFTLTREIPHNMRRP